MADINTLMSAYSKVYPDAEFWQWLSSNQNLLSESAIGRRGDQTGAILRELYKRYQSEANTTLPAQSPGLNQPGTSKIINNYQGTGYDVTVQYDKNGNPVITDVLGESRSEGATPYQQAQLDLAERKWQAEDFATRQQLAIEGQRNRQSQITNQWSRYNSQFLKKEDGTGNRDVMAQTYEDWRRRLLGELGDSRDWITKWQVQNQPNPYTPQISDIDSLKSTLESAKAEEQNAKAALADWTKRTTDNTEIVDPQILAAAAERYNMAVQQLNRWQGEVSAVESTPEYQKAATPQPTGVGGNKVISGLGGNEPPRPTAPPVPKWLPQFVPQLAGKSQIERMPVAAPSGQVWQATPTSIKQGLAGYMDYSGQDYRDTLDYMKMMLPNNPSGVPTAWSPRR